MQAGAMQAGAIQAGAFEGEWHLWRVIEDRAGGPAGASSGRFTGLFTGVARFLPVAGGQPGPLSGALDYAEEGELRLGRAAFRATRAYRWVLGPGGVEVFFADGRFFHGFAWEAAVAEHPCGADLYRVRYDFARWPEWQAVWEVRGPRKDYVMRSQYRREG